MRKLHLDIDRLKSEMGRLGWTQTKLAHEMGMSRQWVNQIFTKPESASLATIEKIARAIGKPGIDLIWDFEHPLEIEINS